MKHLVYILIVVVMGSVMPVAAQDAIQRASTAYNNGEYGVAINEYELIADSLGTSSELFYNLGNSYYRLGELGKAVLYYERALKLNPANEDARFNLEFVNEKLTANDSKDVDDVNILGVVVEVVKNSNSANGWAIIAVVSFILMVIAIMLYIFAYTIMVRKISFFGGIFLFVIVVVANIFAFSVSNGAKEAVVTAGSVVLSTSPRAPKDKSEEAYLLNEGVKLTIMDSLKTITNDSVQTVWFEVKVKGSNSKSWVNAQQVEVI